MNFKIDHEDYFPLRDLKLEFKVIEHNSTQYTLTLVQVDVDSKFFSDWQRLEIKDIPEQQIKDWEVLGQNWYESRVRWKNKEYEPEEEIYA